MAELVAHCLYSIRNLNKKINKKDPLSYQVFTAKSLILQGIFPRPGRSFLVVRKAGIGIFVLSLDCEILVQLTV